MPPTDRRLCPDLERALPSDSVPGSAVVLTPPEPWLVLFGSGEWRPVLIRAWRADRHGRRVIHVSWHADGSTWNESYLYDARKIREA